MMRKTPLKRKTPLARGISQLRRKTRLAPVSKKMKEKNKTYSQLRKSFLAGHVHCSCIHHVLMNPDGRMVQCGIKATQVHHMQRRGKFHNDTSTWLAICLWCHQWVEANGKEAEQLGLLKRIR